MYTIVIQIVLLVACILSLPVHAQITVMVDDDAKPGGDGLTWSTAFIDLQDAISLARTDPNVREIWVAAGNYRPDRRTRNLRARFELVTGVGLYGGFAGDETQRDQRNPDVNETILNGDLLNDDEPDFINYDDNAYHVVRAYETYSETTIIDGFSIRGGHTTSTSLYERGAGLLIMNGSLTVSNCQLYENWCYAGSGGGIAIIESNGSDIQDCFIHNNLTRENGGGILIDNFSDVYIARCEINNNNSLRGGGIFTAGPFVRIDNTSFIQNSGGGGGIQRALGSLIMIECYIADNYTINEPGGRHGGGISNAGNTGRLTVINSRITGNRGYTGRAGGIYQTGSSLALINCVIDNNHGGNGGVIGIWSGNARFRNCSIINNTGSGGLTAINAGSSNYHNCILWNNGSNPIIMYNQGFDPTIIFSNIDFSWDGDGNINANPQFVDDSGTDINLRLMSGSPCIDAAWNNSVEFDEFDLDNDGNTSEPIPFDYAGNTRLVDTPEIADSGEGVPPIVDMGAYELVLPEEAVLTDLLVSNGTLRSGGIDELLVSDDTYVETISGFGETLTDFHNMEMSLNAQAVVEEPYTLSVSIESQNSDTGGIVEIRLRNWNNNRMIKVATRPVGLNDSVRWKLSIDAARFVSSSGEMKLSFKYILLAPFLAFRFESYIDQVQVLVR